MNTITTKTLASIFALLVGFASFLPSAHAQNDLQDHMSSYGSPMLVGYAMMTTMAAYTAGIVIVGASSTTYLGVTTSSSISALNLKSAQATNAYLDSNQRSVLESLALGGGHASGELAQMFEIPTKEHETFARMLRKNRKSLRAVMSMKSGVERGKTFLLHMQMIKQELALTKTPETQRTRTTKTLGAQRS